MDNEKYLQMKKDFEDGKITVEEFVDKYNDLMKEESERQMELEPIAAHEHV